MSESILEAENISKQFAGHKGLDYVPLHVPRQSVYGLLGPNGAGKTTFLRIVNRITGPDTGKVYFNGEKLMPKHIEQIGYLPEERGLYRKMKVGEQAVYLACLKGMEPNQAKLKLKEWFEKFEISTWWNYKVEELSKGMQQKVQFITTVLHQPKLLILDEPFSGFDPINTQIVKEEILKLREQGTTIIFSTHNMSSVEEICTHIALINQGTKILEGQVRKVREGNREFLYELTFKGSPVAFANALWTGYQLVDKVEKDGEITAKVKMLNNNTPNDLLKAVIPVVQVVSLQEILPSMNEIFIKKVTEMSNIMKNNYKKDA